MKLQKFKIGDKVRCRYSSFQNKICTIINVTSLNNASVDFCFEYHVKFEDKSYFTLYQYWLDKIIDCPEYMKELL